MTDDPLAGLDGSHQHIYLLVYHHGPCDRHELASWSGLSLSRIREITTNLIKRGHLQGTYDPNDARHRIYRARTEIPATESR